MSAREPTTTSFSGESYGSGFDDQVGIPDLNTTAITHIVVGYDDKDGYIRSLTVHYNNKVGVTRGGTGSSRVDVILTPGEFITEVEGKAGTGVLVMIVFRTSKGVQWGPYGEQAANSDFVWKDFGPRMGLLYFAGTADTYMRSLCATFGTYNDPDESTALTTVVKYEKQAFTELDELSPTTLCKFALNLIAPPITLLVGPDSVRFHVPKTLLCTLPFFAAALHGVFRESTEQRIIMPEDDAHHVAALIEYLYTGGYTYSYTPPSASATDAAPADLEEGSFHVGVYATAFKYDCQPLVKASLTSFVGVLRQLKGIDVIRLWEVAYDRELLLATVHGDKDLVGFRQGLVTLLKELYTNQREEMDRTSAGHPALINDLLGLVVMG